MKLLLTSAGISNASIQKALVELLGKPISESSALCIPTGIYPFSGGPSGAYRFITGTAASPLCELGWKSLGVLELTALPSVARENWIPGVQEADALLVWGGDVLYLRRWMLESGLADLLPTLPNMVYVGVSAGSIVATTEIAETYTRRNPPTGDGITSQPVTYTTPEGEVCNVNLVRAPGLGLVDASLLPHVFHEQFPENALENLERWADMLPSPLYAMDDQTALKVVDGAIEVISEGNWKLIAESGFRSSPPR